MPRGIETDDVVCRTQLRCEREGRELGVLHPGRARAAGVDEQRAEALVGIGGRGLAHREGETVAARLRVVDGDLDRRALMAGAVAAGLPVHLLGVEGRQLCRVVGVGRPGRGGRCSGRHARSRCRGDGRRARPRVAGDGLGGPERPPHREHRGGQERDDRDRRDDLANGGAHGPLGARDSSALGVRLPSSGGRAAYGLGGRSGRSSGRGSSFSTSVRPWARDPARSRRRWRCRCTRCCGRRPCGRRRRRRRARRWRAGP